MKTIHDYETLLAGTLFLNRIVVLRELYADADRAIETFIARISVESARETAEADAGNFPVCPHGCGKCCETYYPEVSAVEAECIALHLAATAWEMAMGGVACGDGKPNGTGGPCPFYRADNALHCGIYPVRPLICRLFGFTSDTDRNGIVRFRYCRHMEREAGRTVPFHEMERVFGVIPPAMGDYGVRLACLSTSDEGPHERIDRAVVQAIGKIRFLGGFLSDYLDAADHFSGLSGEVDDHMPYPMLRGAEIDR